MHEEESTIQLFAAAVFIFDVSMSLYYVISLYVLLLTDKQT